MKRLNLLLAAVFVAMASGCPNKSEVPASTTEAPAANAVAPTSAKLIVNGKSVELPTVLVWDALLADQKVPQISFYQGAAGCDDRLNADVPRFFAAFLADSVLAVGGPYQSPNWGYSGKPGFVPGSDPNSDWGSVIITGTTATTVKGSVAFSSNGVELRGMFEATRCPDQ